MKHGPILAIDCAARELHVALADGNGVRSRSFAHEERSQQERLAPAIRSLLDDAGVVLAGCGGVAVIAGPGSFTGLRIALSAAKALAWAAGIPLFAENRLDLMARGWAGDAPDAPWVMPIVDARRKSVFTALYRDGRRHGEYRDVSLETLGECFENPGRFFGMELGPLHVIGDLPAPFKNATGPRVRFVEGTQRLPIEWLCASALGRLERGEAGEDPRALAPFYLRLPEPMLKPGGAPP